jgi:hypothetical protein
VTGSTRNRSPAARVDPSGPRPWPARPFHLMDRSAEALPT